jgi:glycosyltransferase involved in cell wall biosynthesis
MKIGIDVSQAVYGTGVSDYTINLVNNLISLDTTDQFILFASSLRRTADLKKIFPQAQTFRFPPTFLNLLWNHLHAVNVETFIGPVDVFHSSDWLEPPSIAPKVTTVHDLSPFLFPDEMRSGIFRNISAVHSARMNWVVKESAKIICVSESTARELQSIFKIHPDKIVVIPEALPDRFAIHPSASEITQVKRQYNLTDYIIAIGTPQPRKNISRLVKSFLTYKDLLRLPEKLVIVGGHGWGMTDIPVSHHIVFTGYLPDRQVASLLAGSQAFVYPSLHEGFGLPILNAFYQQIPVVTSNCSSMPEVASEAAVLVNPKSETEIAHGMQLAVANRAKYIALGRQRLKHFSWQKAAKSTLMVYNELCA